MNDFINFVSRVIDALVQVASFILEPFLDAIKIREFLADVERDPQILLLLIFGCCFVGMFCLFGPAL